MNPYNRDTCLPYVPKPDFPANPYFCLTQQCGCGGGATVGGCFPYAEGECHRIYAGPLPEPGPMAGYNPQWDTTPCGGSYSENVVAVTIINDGN